MLKEIAAIARRSRATMLTDALGAGALAVMLMVALHIPAMI